MQELKRYIIEGQIQDELISEMDRSNKIVNNEENEYMQYKATKLVEGVLREFEMAIGSIPPVASDPYKDVDPRVKKSQQLTRLLTDNLYKLCDAQRTSYPGEEVDADIKALMVSNVEPTIKALVNKLHSLWFGEAKQEPEKQEPNEVAIVVGQEVVTPQSESYKVRQISGNKIILEGLGGTKTVEKSILEKWIKG